MIFGRDPLVSRLADFRLSFIINWKNNENFLDIDFCCKDPRYNNFKYLKSTTVEWKDIIDGWIPVIGISEFGKALPGKHGKNCKRTLFNRKSVIGRFRKKLHRMRWKFNESENLYYGLRKVGAFLEMSIFENIGTLEKFTFKIT